jgi:GNL3L/Grn1 putative GTPase
VLVGKPKDPGIANEFPYKDQILAEVAEERRRVCLAHVLVVQRADCALTFE